MPSMPKLPTVSIDVMAAPAKPMASVGKRLAAIAQKAKPDTAAISRVTISEPELKIMDQLARIQLTIKMM